ncbi:MAG: DUF3341 domain-containing protein, partial [Deltaproteobacteria bacterium]|nr:DUF3341 domain-containing protein [Deltaproteobacteria bacterium]
MITMLKNYALLAEYKTPHEICHAAEEVRKAGYKKWDACTPFPVHGLDKAMGLKDSVLPWAVLVAGIIGCVLISWLMIWISAYDYPLNIGGKPTWSVPAFVPPAFEVTILFSSLAAVFGMLFLNGLPRLHHPLFHSKLFEKVTDDRFFIVIEAQDKLFDVDKTRE